MQDRYNSIGLFQQILSLNLVPRQNGTNRNDTSLREFSGRLVLVVVVPHPPIDRVYRSLKCD